MSRSTEVMTRSAALAGAARIVVREVADAQMFARIVRNAGCARLAEAIEQRLATVKQNDIGGEPKPDPQIWRNRHA